MTQLFNSWAYAQRNPHLTIEIVAPHIHCCLIHCSKELESISFPIKRLIDNGNLMYIQNGMLLSSKEK